MGDYYAAIDIGASSGRVMLSWMENGKMVLEEVHRFPNGLSMKNGELCWDYEFLFAEMKTGLKKCKELGMIPKSVGVDTWGVDFVLLDDNDKIIGQTVGYRDSRTEGCDELVYQVIKEDDLYQRTGIQKQMFNTIYQLMAIKTKKPEELKKAKTFLMVPDYFHYLFTNVKANEYTEGTTSQLMSPVTFDWDYELIEMLGYPKEMFQKVLMPGTVLGKVTPEVAEELGYETTIVLPATHDTGSAVLAVPTNVEDTLYISSGTWSLMGVERKQADCSLDSKVCNFTNEGGYDHRFRYLKNIMGLWMIQSVKKELNDQFGFAELCEKASKETIPSIVDCNDDVFLAPKSMIEAIKNYCKESNQQVPETEGELAAVIYNSLAKCYEATVRQISDRMGITYDRIHVVGGGSNAGYLNELTAKYTGLTVYAGPSEATAIGNIAVQMMTGGELSSLQEARSVIFDSFSIQKFEK